MQGVPDSNNPERAERGIEAIQLHRPRGYAEDPYTAMKDLLTDVMHAADLLALDFGACLAGAEMHHTAEVEGDDFTDTPDDLRPIPCPHCGTDLSVLGAVGQQADESGEWSAHIERYEFGGAYPAEVGIVFEKFETQDTRETTRFAYCVACDRDIDPEDLDPRAVEVYDPNGPAYTITTADGDVYTEARRVPGGGWRVVDADSIYPEDYIVRAVPEPWYCGRGEGLCPTQDCTMQGKADACPDRVQILP